MSVLINKKRCDNADVCSCIGECPTKAFHFDKESNSVAVDNDLCINCRRCVLACEAGAVKVARNEEEYNQIKTENDEDIMTIEELFQDRFGASIVLDKYSLELSSLDDLIKDSNKCLLIEFYNEDEACCLINSIPIKEILDSVNFPLVYRKINVTNIELLNDYNVSELPTLIIFEKGNVIYRRDGFIHINDKDALLNELSKLNN